MFVPVDHVAFRARLQPHRLALRDLTTGRTWSYVQLDHAVARTARVLRAVSGLGAGDRVASLARNRAELVLLHLACARIGAIYVPLNWRLSLAEIAALIDDCAPRLLVCDDEHMRGLADAGVNTLALETLGRQANDAMPLPPEPIDAERPSLILYTSGTSGRPKGVLLSERNLGQVAESFSLLGQVNGDSVFLADAPMFHIIGLVTNVRPALMQGATILVSDGFDAARTLARLSDPRLRVTHFFGVPQMVAMLRAQSGFDPAALRGLTGIFTGGAPHPAADIRAWLADGIVVVNGYGSTEAGTVFGMPLDPALNMTKAGSVGICPAALGVRIVDANGTPCPAGIPGELLLKGDNVFSGYWRRPEETAAALDADGWFATGDIATCDEDGYFAIVDRKKDMFISGGENIYPAEIEAALVLHPDIAEVAVVGMPDARWGEIGHAVVVPVPGAVIDLAALQADLGTRLARYKLPKRLTLVEALPRTGSGKVMKAQLRARLLASYDTPNAGADQARQSSR